MKIVRGAAVGSHGKRRAGRSGVGWGANILKHSERLLLAVTDGLKVSSSPFAMSAFAFFSRRWWVKVRASFWEGAVGFSFGDNFIMIASAASAHLCGFLHPFRRSSSQHAHLQLCHGMCFLSPWQRRLQSFTRFFTFDILWTRFRHSSLDL